MTLLVLFGVGCSGSQREAERPEETPAEETVVAEPVAEVSEPAPDENVAIVPTGRDTVVQSVPPTGSVAPAPGREPAAVKNWMLIEFVRAVEEADLRWLEENGFRVDTVMGEKMVRGWLEVPAAGAVIAQDARVARIDAQMR